MLKISVTGGWGDRPEDLDTVAAKLSKTLRDMPEEPAGEWCTPRQTSRSSYVYDPLDVTDVREVAARIEQTTRDVWGGKPRTRRFDVKAYRVTDEGEYAVRCSFRVGLGGGPRPESNHVLVALEFPDGDTVETARLIKDYVALIVRNWQPEHVSAQETDFMGEQGKKGGQLSVGWDTYLADSIEFDEELVAQTIPIEHADGGRYLTLGGTPGAPSLEQALLVRKALGY